MYSSEDLTGLLTGREADAVDDESVRGGLGVFSIPVMPVTHTYVQRIRITRMQILETIYHLPESEDSNMRESEMVAGGKESHVKRRERE